MNDIERTISEYMRECIDENEEVLKARCQEAGKEAVREIRKESRKNTGAYAKGWTYKVEQDKTGTSCTVHNKKHYQLTHLLEKGHKITNQTHQNYGTAPGDNVLAKVAETVGERFASGGGGE